MAEARTFGVLVCTETHWRQRRKPSHWGSTPARRRPTHRGNKFMVDKKDLVLVSACAAPGPAARLLPHYSHDR